MTTISKTPSTAVSNERITRQDRLDIEKRDTSEQEKANAAGVKDVTSFSPEALAPARTVAPTTDLKDSSEVEPEDNSGNRSIRLNLRV